MTPLRLTSAFALSLTSLFLGANGFAQAVPASRAGTKPSTTATTATTTAASTAKTAGAATQLPHRPFRTELDGPAYIGRLSAAATAVNSFNFLGENTVLAPLSSGVFTGLLRQPDCSVSLMGATVSGTPALQSTTPKYGDVLHKLAGLTTTPDLFANGCADFGHTPQFSLLAGKTAAGADIGAQGQLNGTETSITTYVYDPVAMKVLSSAVYPIGPNGGDIVAADVNGDGVNDLLVENYDANGNGGGAGTVAVLLGNADGTFAAAVQYTLGTEPFSVLVADVNGDGKLDIVSPVSTPSGGEEINVLLGKGDGTFSAAISTAFTGNGSRLDAGDVNGDGKTDLVLASGVVLLGNGDGTFTQATTLAVLNRYAVVLADINHDGKLDAAFTEPIDNTVSIYLGKGDGTFTVGPSYATIYGTERMGAADFDGDGNVDLFLGATGNGAYFPDENQGGSSQVIMSNGVGGGQGAPVLTGFGNAGAFTRGIATGDFNGDGKLDLLGAAPASSGILVYAGDGKGGLTPGAVSPAPVAGPIIAADFNGDSKLDAAGSDSATSSIYTAAGNGDGTFQAAVEYAVPQLPVDLQAADLNGDGKLDIVALGYNSPYSTGTPGAGMYFFKNNGDGTFAAAQSLDSTLTTPANLAIADVNGDGKLDLIVAESGSTAASSTTPGDVRLYLGNGDGTFQAPTVVLPSVYTAGLVVSDVNGDGKLDITTQTYASDFSSGNAVVLLGNGDGTFQAAKSTTIPDPFGLTNLAVADLNGDGKVDLVSTACCGATSAYIYAGNGDGTFQTGVILSLASSPSYVVAADLSGSGYPALLFGIETYVGGLQSSNIVELVNTDATLVASTSTALTVSPNPTVAGQSVTLSAQVTSTGTAAPTGSVNFFDGSTQIGTGTLTAGAATFATATLAVGTHSLTAQYAGDANNVGSTSSAISLAVTTVPVIPTTTTLTLSASSVVLGASATLTATVAPQTGSGIPTGTVTFLDGATQLGTGTLDPTGKTTYSTSTLALGSHSLTASYGGDATNAASISAVATLTVTAAAPDFSLALGSSTLTMSGNGRATVGVTVTPVNGFDEAVALTCSGLPAEATCGFSPATVTPASAAATSVLTITTGVKSTSNAAGSAVAFSAAFGLFGLGLLGRRRSRPRAFGLVLLIAAAITGLGGCGGSSKSGTPSGTTTVTVTATAGSTAHTTTLALTVE